MLALLSLSISHSLQPSVESADAPLPGALYLDATFAAKSSSSLCAKGTSGKGCKTVALSPDGPALPRAAGEAIPVPIPEPVPSPAPCAACAQPTEYDSWVVVNATLARCLRRCEARAARARATLEGLDAELGALRADADAASRAKALEAEVQMYRQLAARAAQLSGIEGDPLSAVKETIHSAARLQLMRTAQEKEIASLRAYITAQSLPPNSTKASGATKLIADSLPPATPREVAELERRPVWRGD